jgi:hypothetical protein
VRGILRIVGFYVFIFAVGGDGGRLFLYGVVVGSGGVQAEVLEDWADGMHLFGSGCDEKWDDDV